VEGAVLRPLPRFYIVFPSLHMAFAYGTVDQVGNSNGGPPLTLTEGSSHHGTNGPLLTAALLVADVVGAGILSMATAVARLGWLLGAILIVVLLVMNVHTSLLMWRVRMHFPAANTYSDLVRAAFQRASPVQQQAAVVVSASVQYFFILMMLALYTLSFGKALGMIFHDVHLCLVRWTLVGCALVLPFHLTTRTLGGWQLLIWINILTIVASAFVPIIQLATMGIEQSRPAGSVVQSVAPVTSESLLTGISTFSFAFTSQFMVVEIISEMQQPALFYKAYVWMSAPFQCLAFLFVGIVGYYYVGSSATGMIGDSVPFGISFRIIAACLLFHMLVTYMVKGTVMCRFMNSWFDTSFHEKNDFATWLVWACIVLSVLSLSFVVAQSVPFFTDLVDFLGAFTAPVCCYIMPILVFLRWYQDFGQKDFQISIIEWCVLVSELCLSVILMVMGTFYTVNHITHHWETYGYPFACHCENIWDTCACSASHAGMEFCLSNSSSSVMSAVQYY